MASQICPSGSSNIFPYICSASGLSDELINGFTRIGRQAEQALDIGFGVRDASTLGQKYLETITLEQHDIDGASAGGGSIGERGQGHHCGVGVAEMHVLGEAERFIEWNRGRERIDMEVDKDHWGYWCRSHRGGR
jgi:hypothetical protein